MKEIIPIRDDQGISYKYKYYEANADLLEKALKNKQ